ncbi:MAG: SRPBCC domain-containing protein [Chitinophagaceae bacterium]|nr:SRPBCC domain-containing protein [Chitinophagaceae bacterium]
MLVTAQIIIHRPSSEVLEAFLHTQHTQAWWQGCHTFADVAAGYISWQWRDADGRFQYISSGALQQYEPGLFLQIRHMWQYDVEKANPLGPVDLLIECTPQSGHTLLHIQHGPFATHSAEWQAYAAAVESGWQQVLPQLKQYLESATV